MTSKKTDTTPDTDPQLPVVKLTVKGFADKVEKLMNEAGSQSHPDAQPEHHQKFADWCNALGDLWREVKQHGQ